MTIRHSLVAAAAAALACLPLLGANGTMLSPMAGNVEVNGLPVTAGSAVVAGDRVSINDQGSARMVLPGASVIAASNTRFRMENARGIRLEFGLVKIPGNLPVAVSNRTVVPRSSGARFSVTALHGPVYVQAIQGNLDIRSRGASYTVHTGQAVTFQGTSPAASASSSSTHCAEVPLPIAIAAGAAAAAVSGVIVHSVTTCTNCVTSPSM